MLRSAYFFGGFTLTKSEISQVNNSTKKVNAKKQGRVSETMRMFLTNCTKCSAKYAWWKQNLKQTQENSKFCEGTRPHHPQMLKILDSYLA